VAPNSPNLNSVDYAVWGALHQRVYHKRKFKHVEELKQRFIDSSINEWHRRLEYVVKNGGERVEHCNLS